MTDTIDTTTTDTGLSRRSLLAKLGVGTAIAWATPALVTMNVPAGAGGGGQPPNQNAACRENAKEGRPACAICDPPFCNTPGQNQNCFCVATVQQLGCCWCTQGNFIGAFGQPCPTTATSANCNRDNQCPPGWRCAYNCSCPPTNLAFKGRCVPPCALPACAHSECSPGVALQVGCSSCVTAVCSLNPSCCTTTWDSVCAGLALEVCGDTCSA